ATRSRAEPREVEAAHAPHAIRASEVAWSARRGPMRDLLPSCSRTPTGSCFCCPCVQHSVVIESIYGAYRYGTEAPALLRGRRRGRALRTRGKAAACGPTCA